MSAGMHPDLPTAQARDALAHDGFFYVVNCGREKASALARALGSVIAESEVRLISGSRALVTSDKPIPLHTDHGRARYIAWFCYSPAESGGETLLCDMAPVIESLPQDTREWLAARTIREHVVFGGDSGCRPILFGSELMSVYYAPWLLNSSILCAGEMTQFTNAIMSAERANILLRAGDFLVIDNWRMLHGRAEMGGVHRRRLRRWWIEEE